MVIVNEYRDDRAEHDDKNRHEFVFLFEERHGATGDGGVDFRQTGFDVRVIYTHVDGDFIHPGRVEKTNAQPKE